MREIKSYKILQVFPNGCVFRDYLIYSKIFKKYNFLKKDCTYNSSKNIPSISSNSNFFYTKYRNQIIKNFINESTINN